MILEYKGYRTKIEFDREDNIFYGKIEGIHDFVNFHLKRNFTMRWMTT